MRVPKVILVGGPPFVGKSTVARCIAARYQYGCISTDDIGKAVGVLTTSQTHPGLHRTDDIDYQEYFSLTSVDLLIEHARRSHEILWPGLEKIIRASSSWGDPLVMEGYALWPDWVKAANFTATGSVWLTCDDHLLETRIRSRKDFYSGASDEEALITNILRRSSRYNQLLEESAVECCINLVRVCAGQSADDVADLCISVLEEEQDK